jgi:hypothetical protein
MAGPQDRRRGLAAVIFVLVGTALAASGSSDAATRYGTMSFLDNGKIRVGVSLNDGGKIQYLAAATGPLAHNLVQGVGIEQSYYGGPTDRYWQANADGATVVANRNDGHVIYTKVIAQQPFPAYGECPCIFETWLWLKANTVHVRNRLTNFRSDGMSWTAHWQELPALYTSGDAYRLFTYDGEHPYTGGALREITEDRGGFFSPGPSFRATEHWAALVNDERYGVGLFNPKLVRFSGIPGTEGAVQWHWVNGYMSTPTRDILDSNISYTYDYTLILGSLDEIRAYAEGHRPDPRPAYHFRSNRQHWWELNATDAGWPIRGALRVFPDRSDPQLYGPETEFSASRVSALYVRGAWHTRQRRAELFWDTDGFSGDRRFIFDVRADGRFHTYRIKLSGYPDWLGMVHGLRLDPVRDAELGSWIDITCMSWKPCPRDRDIERRLSQTRPVAFHDSFDAGPNPVFWSPAFGSETATTQTSGGNLVVSVNAEEAPQSAGVNVIGTGIRSRCTLSGNYDVRVDYRLLEWPPSNGVHLNLTATGDGSVGRLNQNADAYFAHFPPTGAGFPTTDTTGTLRLVRSRTALFAYKGHAGAWTLIGQSSVVPKPTSMELSISSDDAEFGHQVVQVAFDNFEVVRGRLSC